MLKICIAFINKSRTFFLWFLPYKIYYKTFSKTVWMMNTFDDKDIENWVLSWNIISKNDI